MIQKIKSFRHDVKIFDPNYEDGYIGAKIEEVSVDWLSSIITAINDRRKSGGVSV